MTKVEKLYSKSQLNLLREEHKLLKPKEVYGGSIQENQRTTNNLFNLTDRYPKNRTVCCVNEVFIGSGTLKTNYYLDYRVGSFSRMHIDEPDVITAITLLNKSEDLEGGALIVVDLPYRAPRLLELEIGDTALIKEESPHGVTVITKGWRCVHVGWWMI